MEFDLDDNRTSIMRGLFLLFSLVCSTVWMSCVKQNPSNVILIGEVSSMTGGEATYGLSAHRGIELALEQVNARGGIQGKKLKLVSMDSQGKPDESARAIAKLISQDGVSAVVTGVISSNALAMAPIAQKNSVPMLATISTHPKVTEQGDQIFRICLMDSFQGTVMAKFALEHLKLKKIVIMRDVKSDYSVGLSETFASVLKAGGGEILMEQSYSGGDIDFKAQLTAVRGKAPDAIYVPGYYSDVSLIARQARELGLSIPLLGGDGWDSPKLKEIGGDALSGSYFSGLYSPEGSSPLLKKFLESYQIAYQTAPDGLAVMGYEGMQVLADAMARAQPLNSKGIREALATTRNFEAVTGKISMDSHRNALRSAVVLRVEKDGHLKYTATVQASENALPSRHSW